MNNPLFLIIVPFIFGCLLAFVPKSLRTFGVVLSSILIGCLSSIFFLTFDLNEPVQLALGSWRPPLGIQLVVDGMSLGFSSISTIIFILLTFYSLSFLKLEGIQTRFFWPVWFFTLSSLNALFFSYDIFNLYVTLELVTFCSVILVSFSGTQTALKYSLNYLIYALLGSLFYLMGVVFIYGQVGALDFDVIHLYLGENFLTYLSFIFIILGLLIKGALYPFHFWLPGAHSSAMPPISALLSAVVVKTSFFMAVKIYFIAFQGRIPTGFLYLLGTLGAVAVFWGSLKAIASDRLKLIIAYSTVAQVGYLYLIFPYTTFSTQGFANGAFIHFAAHAFAKSSMFLAVGNIFYAVGSDRVDAIKGIRNHLKMSLMSIGLSGVTLMGLPISGGFIAKWYFIEGSFNSPQWWWAIVPLMGGLLSFIYIFKILNSAMSTAQEHTNFKSTPFVLELIALTLAILSILVGFTSNFILEVLSADFLILNIKGEE